MKNLIIKKDIKSNWLVYLLATISIIILTLILSNVYLIENLGEQFGGFITVLAYILMFLLSLSILVYVLINNFYSDKHRGLLPKIKSYRKYLYYRIVYAYLSLFFFIFVGVVTVIITTDLSWMDIFENINATVIVIIINVFLVYFCFFMASFYKTKYNFKIPIRVIIGSVLLLLSLLFTLFVTINATFIEVIYGTTASVILGIILIALNISAIQKYRVRFIIIDVILIIAILVFGVSYAQIESSNYSQDYNNDGEYYYEEENVTSEPSDFTLVYENNSEIGEVVVYKQGENYTMYIDGDYKTIVTIGNPNGTDEKKYTDINATNYKTGETVSYSAYPTEGGIDLYVTASTVENGKISYCENNVYADTNEVETAIESLDCVSEEQTELMKNIENEIEKSLEVINE